VRFNAQFLLEKAIRVRKTAYSIAGAIIDAAPTWYWRLDETTGTDAVDEMGNEDLTYESDASTAGYSIGASGDNIDGNAKDINADSARQIYEEGVLGEAFNSPTDYVAYWTLNEASGNFLDSSANSHTATPIASPTYGETGQVGDAVLFNGTSQYATVVNHADLRPSNLTVSAWVKTSTTQNAILSVWDTVSGGTRYGFRIYVDGSGSFVLEVADGTGSVQGTNWEVCESAKLVDDDTWHHVVGTFDGTDMLVYVDGVLETSVNFPLTIGYGTPRPRIGVRDSTFYGVQHYFDGTLDDIKLYDYAITAQEVQDTFLEDGGRLREVHDYIARWQLDETSVVETFSEAVITAAPTNFWQLDETSGTVATDTMGDSNLTYQSNANTVGYSVASSRDDAVGAAKQIDTGTPNETTRTITTADNTVGLPTGSDWTVELAFNMSSYDTTMTLFASNGGGAGIRIDIANTDKLDVSFTDSTSTGDFARTTLSLTEMGITTGGEWHYLSARMDYSNLLLDLFIDGVQRATRVVQGNGISKAPTPGHGTAIGCYNHGALYAPWGGAIDVVAFYDRAITDAERGRLYNLWLSDSDDSLITAYDSTYRNHDGSIEGTPTSTTGQIGTAFTFDGTDDYISLTNHADLRPTEFTVSAWVKTTTSLASTIFASYSQETGAYSIVAGFILNIAPTTGLPRLTVGRDTNEVISVDYEQAVGTSDITDGAWHHVAGTYDGAEIKIYIDGVLEDTVAWAGGVVYDSTNVVAIGARSDDGSTMTRFLDGDIDDARLYGRAITQSEVITIYQSRLEAPPEDFVAEWGFDASDGTETLGNHDATLVATPTFETGWEGNAMTLNGSTQYATITDHDDLKPSEISVAFWFRAPYTGNIEMIVQNQLVTGVGTVWSGWWIQKAGSGQIAFHIAKNTGLVQDVDYVSIRLDGETIDDNEWRHFTFTYDGTDLKSYMNGTLMETKNAPAFLDYAVGETHYCQIGSLNQSGIPANFLMGSVDKVQIFDRAVTGEEAIALAMHTPYPTGAVTYSAGDISTSSDFTIECAFKIDTATEDMTLLSKGISSGGWGLSIDDEDTNALVLVLSDGSERTLSICSDLAAEGVAADGVWHWLSVRMDYNDTGLLTCRIDCSEVSSTDISSWTGSWSGSDSDQFTIGDSSETGSTAWDGGVDEVAIYNKAITDEQRALNCSIWGSSTTAPTVTPMSVDVDVADITTNIANGEYTTPLLTCTVTDGSGQLEYLWTSDGAKLTPNTPTSATTTFTGDHDNDATTETLTCTVTDVGDANNVEFDTVTTDIKWGTIDDYFVHYTFDDVTGFVIADETANSHDATMGSAPIEATGHDGYGMLFSGGASDEATVVDHADWKSSEFTYNAWINPTSGASTTGAIFQSYYYVGSDIYGTYASCSGSGSTKTITFKVYAGTGNIQGTDFEVVTTTVSADTYSMVTFSYDDATLKIYVNGTLSNSTAFIGGVNYHASNAVLIGGSSAVASTTGYAGIMDEFMGWGRALSAGEITQLYNLPATPSTPSTPFSIEIDPTGLGGLVYPSAPWSDSATVIVTGGVGSFTYLWTKVSGSGVNISGSATGATCTFAGQQYSTETLDVFKVVVTDTGNGNVTLEDTITVLINWDAV